jgi:hypothetical protein
MTNVAVAAFAAVITISGRCSTPSSEADTMRRPHLGGKDYGRP